jgi:hypothetical protein
MPRGYEVWNILSLSSHDSNQSKFGARGKARCLYPQCILSDKGLLSRIDKEFMKVAMVKAKGKLGNVA